MRMTTDQAHVTAGVDAHADTHEAAALDERGRLLGTRTFRTGSEGYRELLAWLEQFGELVVVGVESTGSYAAGLVRFLGAHGVDVVEVNRPHAHTRRRRGKSDPIDAEMAARQALSGDASAIPKTTTGIVESIRQLRVARDGAVKARSAALCQLSDVIVTAPDGLRERLSQRKRTRAKANLCLGLRPRTTHLGEPAEAAKLALRSLARRIQNLDEEIAALDKHLGTLVATAAPRTTKLLGISTGHAGQLLVTAGQNIERLRSDGAFAALCGASPVPVSSGRRSRHRLNPGGDRDANRTLHMIAVVRLRYCHRTRAYAQRRSTEGKTKREIIRCLKRYIARETYRTLCADLHDLQQPPRPAAAVTIMCGAGPIGRARRRT